MSIPRQGGRVAFRLTRLVRRLRPLRRAMLTIARDEQRTGEGPLSGVLWDLFSGSAPYRDILWRMVAPSLVVRWLRVLPAALRGHSAHGQMTEGPAAS